MITLDNYIHEENNINQDWELVKAKIDQNKIFRFSYKKLIGETLTGFITNREHLSNREIEEEFFNNNNVQLLIKLNPSVETKLRESVRISISSRKAEHNSYITRIASKV